MGLKPRRATAATGAVTSMPLAALVARLRDAPLERAARALLATEVEFPLEFPESTGLWIDAPWPTLDVSRIAPPGEHPTVVVFAAPIATDRSLILSYPDMLGSTASADQGAFVFLGEVGCRDLCMVDDKLAIFAGGLVVERLACFQGAKAHAEIAGRLVAPIVISGLGSGGAHVGAGTAIEIGALAGAIDGVPRRSVTSHDAVGDVVPALAGIPKPWRALAERLRRGEPI
jgi:hypothetical protein